MRAVVFAYHTLGVTGLAALVRHGYDLVHVYSHEDDPGENVWFKSVPAWCAKYNIEVSCPKDPNAPDEIARIRALAPDVIFSFYYRSMFKEELLAIPPLGCLNLHGSLLPKYRGRAPVNWAILNGEIETGVTLHFMTKKPDAGDIVGQRAVPIDFTDTALDVYRKLEPAAAELLDEVLPLIKAGRTPRRENRIHEGSYFGGRKPEDGRIDWQWSAERIYNLIRAVTHPYPGAFAELDGEKLMLWWATPDADGHGLAPGELAVRDGRALVGAGQGALALMEIEYQGSSFTGRELLAEIGVLEGKKLL